MTATIEAMRDLEGYFIFYSPFFRARRDGDDVTEDLAGLC